MSMELERDIFAIIGAITVLRWNWWGIKICVKEIRRLMESKMD